MQRRADQPEGFVVCSGAHGEVRFAQMADGSSPAKAFWSSLTIQQQAAFSVLFQKVTNSPTRQLHNREQFKQIEGDLWEFKRINHQMRIFAFRNSDHWYLVYGIRGKKENKIDPGEVVRAKDLMKEAQRFLADKR